MNISNEVPGVVNGKSPMGDAPSPFEIGLPQLEQKP